ncbi:hypothetical protein ACFL2Q_04750 [Thermodesulfobacteriota bacterium]
MDEILNEKFQGNPPTIPSEPIMDRQLELFEDKYESAVKGMFASQHGTPQVHPMKGEVLDSDTYDYVLFGHTHHELKRDFCRLGVTYFNAGSWSVQRDAEGNNTSKCYVVIRKAPEGAVAAEQLRWEEKM